MTGFLASYWYFKSYDFTGFPHPLILDSGAFSAHTQGAEITVPELADFYRRVRAEAGDALSWQINLDVLGDTEASYRNWRRLRDEEGIETVPVVHFTENRADSFDRQAAPYIRDGAPRLCFGGMVGSAPSSFTWAAAGLKWLRDNSPETLTHGLGVGPYVRRARLPWDSTDCSDFGSGYRFGTFKLPSARGRTPETLTVGKGRPPTLKQAALIRRYGEDPRACTSPDAKVRVPALSRLAFRAAEHEEELENGRRERAGIRPVTRFVVDITDRPTEAIRAEMERAAISGPYVPADVPGQLRRPATLAGH